MGHSRTTRSTVHSRHFVRGGPPLRLLSGQRKLPKLWKWHYRTGSRDSGAAERIPLADSGGEWSASVPGHTHAGGSQIRVLPVLCCYVKGQRAMVACNNNMVCSVGGLLNVAV